MKLTLVFALVAAFFVVARAFSVYPLDEQSPEDTQGVRQRRATCDLLSISTPWGSLNHAACAAHCLSMRKGFRGGRCRDGVCRCRK